VGLTDWLAIYAAAASTMGGAWQLFQHFSRGPKLFVRYSPDMVHAGNGSIGTQKYVRIEVSNRGTESTTITNIGFLTYKNWLHKQFGKTKLAAIVPPNNLNQIFPYPLEVGGTYTTSMMQESTFEKMTREESVYFTIYHSFSEKPIYCKVKPFTVNT
jgi:hypothetical protein